MRNLQLGQGRDLYWSYHTHVPTPAQYISMVDGSTYWHSHIHNNLLIILKRLVAYSVSSAV